jgi:hypothetical protein
MGEKLRWENCWKKKMGRTREIGENRRDEVMD